MSVAQFFCWRLKYDTNNFFQGDDNKAWVEEPPARIPYKSQYSDSSTTEEGAGKGK